MTKPIISIVCALVILISGLYFFYANPGIGVLVKYVLFADQFEIIDEPVDISGKWVEIKTKEPMKALFRSAYFRVEVSHLLTSKERHFRISDVGRPLALDAVIEAELQYENGKTVTLKSNGYSGTKDQTWIHVVSENGDIPTDLETFIVRFRCLNFEFKDVGITWCNARL